MGLAKSQTSRAADGNQFGTGEEGCQGGCGSFPTVFPLLFFSFQFQCIWGQQAGKQLVPQGCCCFAWMATGSSCTTLGNCNPTVKSLFTYIATLCAVPAGELLCM